MSWDNISKSLGSVIEERVSNPLVTTFAISWSIINWKFFVLLFSKNTATDTFRLINEICFPTPEKLFGQGILAPLIVTIAYVYLLPPASLWFFKAWKRAQHDIDLVRDQYDREQRLPLDKSQELRRKNAELEGAVDELKETLRISKADLRAASIEIAALKERSSKSEQLNAELRALEEQIERNHARLDEANQINVQLKEQLRIVVRDQEELKKPIPASQITQQLLSKKFSGLTEHQINSIMAALKTRDIPSLTELLAAMAHNPERAKSRKS
jgi:hypothetical protein